MEDNSKATVHGVEVVEGNNVRVNYTYHGHDTVRDVGIDEIIGLVEHKMAGPYCPICGGGLVWQNDFNLSDVFPASENEDGIYSSWRCSSCGRSVDAYDEMSPEDETEETDEEENKENE